MDASDSWDTESAIAFYRFDFGDGTVTTTASPRLAHVYAAGRWLASVTVTDSSGASDRASVDIRAAAPPPRDSSSANLVRNPSFESGLSGWSGYGGATISRAPGGVDGSWSLAVTSPATRSSFGVNDTPNWIARVPAAGTAYRITAWVRALGQIGDAQIQVREYLGGRRQNRAIYSYRVPLGLRWEPVSVDVTALSSGSTFDVQVINTPSLRSAPADNSTFYVDDVSIEVLPPGMDIDNSLAAHPVRDNMAVDARAPRVSPNPMYHRGAIDFSTAQPGPLSAMLFDAAGRTVRVLADEPFAPAGSRHLEIDGRDQAGAPLPAGVYFYRVISSAGRKDGRFVMMR